jgi:hypothetical protein
LCQPLDADSLVKARGEPDQSQLPAGCRRAADDTRGEVGPRSTDRPRLLKLLSILDARGAGSLTGATAEAELDVLSKVGVMCCDLAPPDEVHLEDAAAR